ncbi:MAG: HD domain-containing protein [Thermoleophilaceae bacterium]|nr:HD domain-containing protein [Thermoleophilaceae bacterium]
MIALHDAKPVRAVREALDGGGEAWLVGGVVRDWLLGRELTDVDIAVPGDAAEAARSVAAALKGPAFPLSEAFGAWRAIDRERRLTCDVTPLQGATIEEDLGHRDFTVNAMAVPLGGGELIDPHGGAADLAGRRLRVLGAGAYDADPLRTLRAVRLAAELGLELDAETERLTRVAAPRLSEPSPERVFAELRRLVSAPEALQGLELAARLEVLGAILPELTALTGIEQSRFHHLDVFDHTLEVLRRLMELELDLSSVFADLAPDVAGALSDPLADEMTRGQALRLAALLHDVAKPATRGVRPDGRVTFIGHASAGEEMAGQIFRRLRTSERLRSYVGKLTREHLALGFLVHEMPLSRRGVHAFLRQCEPVEVEVIVLSCADRMATRGEGQEPWIASHLELAREMMAAALQWRANGPPGPLLRGDDLARELGMAPGPEIGLLLGRLEEAAYAGEASSRDDALALARRLRQNQRR